MWWRIRKFGSGFHPQLWRLFGCGGTVVRAVGRIGRLGGMSVGQWAIRVDWLFALFVFARRVSRFLAMMRRARSWVMDRAMIPGAWRRRGFLLVAGARGWLVWASSVIGGAEGGAEDACLALNGRGSSIARHARFLGVGVVGWAEEGGVPCVRRGCHNCPRGSVREADPMLWLVCSIESSGSVLPMLPRR